jgi:hypothetical protein
MNTENKKEDYFKKSQLPWPAAILLNLFILALVILFVFGLVKLVKFFWLL